MSQETVIDNITISQLDEAENLQSGDYLLISEQTQDGKYESKKISYSTLRNQVSTDLSISNLEQRIDAIVLSVETNPVSVQGDGYQIISSFEQDNRGRIKNLSSYQLSVALNFILANVELDNLSATNSPWVQLTDVAKDMNTPTSDKKVVGMSLLSAILSDISSNYILTSNIAQEVGDSQDKVISQKCFYNFLSGLSDQYVLLDDIIDTLSATEIQYDRRKVISQSVFNELKRMILSTLVLKSDIITAFVETPENTVSTFVCQFPDQLCSFQFYTISQVDSRISDYSDYSAISDWYDWDRGRSKISDNLSVDIYCKQISPPSGFEPVNPQDIIAVRIGAISVVIQYDPAFYNPDKVASQVLVKSIKEYADSKFVTKQTFNVLNTIVDKMIPLSDITDNIGDSSNKVMSQKAITEMFDKLSSFQDLDYTSGCSKPQAVFLTPNGIRTRPLLETCYICELESEKTRAESIPVEQLASDFLVTLYGPSYKLKQYIENSWEEIPTDDDEAVCQYLGVGRFARNPLTLKTFFIDESTINKIAEVWDASR